MTTQAPILIGIGANLPSDRFGSPREACEAALKALGAVKGVRVMARSRWFESAPVPASDQPWFINGVVRIETALPPLALLDTLYAIEASFGRVRTVANAPRVLDLDLLAYEDRIVGHAGEGGAHVPHPRMEGRAFVVLPLNDVAPDWVHPMTRRTVAEMVDNLPSDQVCRPLEKRP